MRLERSTHGQIHDSEDQNLQRSLDGNWWYFHVLNKVLESNKDPPLGKTPLFLDPLYLRIDRMTTVLGKHSSWEM